MPGDRLNEMLPSLRHTSLARQAGALIRRAIVSGALRPGDEVRPRELAERLGVSLTPVREALIRLETVGLVEFQPGRVSIASTSEEALRSAFDVREGLEGVATRLAAIGRTDDEAKEISALAEQSIAAVKAGDRDLFWECDDCFHRTISAAAHSHHLQHYLDNALDLALTLRNMRVSSTVFAASAATMHVSIADAIQRRAVEEAERLTREHVRAVREQVLQKGQSVESPRSGGGEGR